MFRPRLIPCLSLLDNGLVKTVRFQEPRYVGDPMNAVKIFNDKQADELMLLDIGISKPTGFLRRKASQEIRWDSIARISGECLMPMSYGGGVRSIEHMSRLFKIGVEKVVLNSAAFEDVSLIEKASDEFGSQSIIASIDVKKDKAGYGVYTRCGSKKLGLGPVEAAQLMQAWGAGEILLNSIDHDGTMAGYDLELIKMVSQKVDVPLIACGGAGSMMDFHKGFFEAGASALAAGSLFVYHGANRAVLINYPRRSEIESIFSKG